MSSVSLPFQLIFNEFRYMHFLWQKLKIKNKNCINIFNLLKALNRKTSYTMKCFLNFKCFIEGELLL